MNDFLFRQRGKFATEGTLVFIAKVRYKNALCFRRIDSEKPLWISQYRLLEKSKVFICSRACLSIKLLARAQTNMCVCARWKTFDVSVQVIGRMGEFCRRVTFVLGNFREVRKIYGKSDFRDVDRVCQY